MTRREVAFLLIGLGVGLIFAVAAIIYFVMWFHHMFIIGFSWKPSSLALALPFILTLLGSILLYRTKSEQTPTETHIGKEIRLSFRWQQGNNEIPGVHARFAGR